MWQTNLIKLYCSVCDNRSTIEAVMQRQSTNFRPQFSDEECITVYLWGISQRRFKQKTIYEYTRNHLLELFPKLPSYQAFSDRLNRLASAFQAPAEYWLSIIGVDLQEQMEYIVNSCPITYGRVRMRQALELKAPEGVDIPSERTVYRVMEQVGLSHHPRRKPTGITKADREARKSGDLLKRDFRMEKTPEECVTDITEIKAKDGKLYVSAIFDCFDLTVLGLTMDDNRASR